MELDWGTQDAEYLRKVELHTEGVLNEMRPDIVVYNAGTDVLDGDPLGGLAISPQVRPSFCRFLDSFIYLNLIEMETDCIYTPLS